jgi:hypothetical protein
MRKFTLLLTAFACSLALAGCGAMNTSTEEEPQRGSLTKSYQLIDDMGRVSGTLVLEPMGRAELRDANGKIIGIFSADQGFVPEN